MDLGTSPIYTLKECFHQGSILPATPVISVLSALEGLEIATSSAKPFLIPLTCIILIGLFTAQRYGTSKIGKIFGPIMLV
ncbi:MAG: KUP/HAK/KT family potassium transporter [Candidatus Sericytochromatia bacterium]|nr:KUP/HAK/KT family potassium transporter [Candidatus Sericytochromatia bacterium]